jgi:hypothetical protein
LAPWNFQKPDMTKVPIDPVMPILATTFRFRSAGAVLGGSILLVGINMFRFLIRDLTAITWAPPLNLNFLKTYKI